MHSFLNLYLITLFALIIQTAVRAQNSDSDGRREAETRPPVLSRIVRVSRGPTIPSSIEEANLRLKSPVYQLRFRPKNRLSHFHGYPTLNGGQIGNPLSIFNLPGTVSGSHPATHHSPHYPSVSAGNANSNNNNYLYSSNNNNNNNNQDVEEDTRGASELEDDEQMPTFTPFIGARALSNMGKFFEHLRENIEALKVNDGDPELEERLLAGNKPDEEGTQGNGWDWDESSEFPSDFSYQHFNEANSASAPLTIKWQPPASGFLHRNNRVSGASQFLSDQDFKKPKFNPSWVKMGLGRKR